MSRRRTACFLHFAGLGLVLFFLVCLTSHSDRTRHDWSALVRCGVQAGHVLPAHIASHTAAHFGHVSRTIGGIDGQIVVSERSIAGGPGWLEQLPPPIQLNSTLVPLSPGLFAKASRVPVHKLLHKIGGFRSGLANSKGRDSFKASVRFQVRAEYEGRCRRSGARRTVTLVKYFANLLVFFFFFYGLLECRRHTRRGGPPLWLNPAGMPRCPAEVGSCCWLACSGLCRGVLDLSAVWFRLTEGQGLSDMTRVT